MSLLNLTNDGLPNVLVALYDAVATAKAPMTRAEVLDTVAPKGLVPDQAMASQTLNTWLKLGLFRQVQEVVTLVDAPADPISSGVALVRAVRMAARQCALAQANNRDLWAVEESLAADMTRSLAWLLEQDVYRFKFNTAEQLEISQLADQNVPLMQNATRRTGLQSWGHFLGFIRQPDGGDIDPTVAIRDVLPELMSEGEELLANDLVNRLSARLPVLDRGAYRLELHTRLRPEFRPTSEAGRLSTSLSRALYSLQGDRTLLFENRADAGSSIVLTGRNGFRNDHRFTHVRRNEEATNAR